MVGEQPLVDHVGQLPFQAAAGLGGGLGSGELALVVVAAGAGVAGLADGDDVHGGVELAVAGAGEPVPA